MPRNHLFAARCRSLAPTSVATLLVAVVTLAVVTLAVAPSALHAQSDSAPAPVNAQRAPICFRGRALPRCRAFFLTEASYLRRLVGTRRSYEESRFGGERYPITIRDLDDQHLSWEVGYMVNRGSRRAVGATLMMGTGDAGGRVAVKGRYRYWIDEGDASLDLSLGVARAGVRNRDFFGVSRGTGLTADVALGVGDFAAFTARAELLRARGRTAGAVHGGVRLGSYPAVGVSAIGAALITAFIVGFNGT